MDNIKLIGAFIVLTLAAVLCYAAWAITTDKAVYGKLGKPPMPVILYMAANALVAIVGTVIIFKL